MRWIPIVLMVAGCGDVQGSDLDGDGLTDDRDDCQTGFADDTLDVDDDGKDATADLCPHDKNAVAGDSDFDGIPDACDPFPAEASPDTRRCVSSFSVRWMNASYLVGRATETAFDLAPPLSATAADTVSIFSKFELPYRSVTFDVLGTAHFRDVTESSSFKLWLRAGDQPSRTDVACGIDGSGNVFVLADNTRQALRPLPVPIDGTFRLRATVQSGAGTTVLCRATAGGQTTATTLPVMFQPGRYGFASAATAVTIDSVVIDSNDAAPPL